MVRAAKPFLLVGLAALAASVAGCRPDYEFRSTDTAAACRDVAGSEAASCRCSSEELATYHRDDDGDGFGRPEETRRSCTGPPEGFVGPTETFDCDDSAPDVHPDVADDEGWQCNGRDDDCDGEVDEACCANPTDRESLPVSLKSVESEPASVGIVGASEGAPERAAFLLVTARDDRLRLHHLDRTGSPVGPTWEVQVSGEVRFVAVDATPDGYAAAASIYSVDDTETARAAIDVVELRPAGTARNSAESIRAREGPSDDLHPYVFHSRAFEATELKRFLVWSHPTDSQSSIAVTGYNYSKNAPTQGVTVELAQNASGGHLEESAPPSVATDGDQFVATWWDLAGGEVAGQIVDASGTEAETFSFALEPSTGPVVDAVPAGDESWLIVHPGEDSEESTVPLRTTAVDSDGSIGTQTTLLEPTDGDVVHPTAFPSTSRTGDGDAPLVAAWRQTNTDAIFTGDVPVGSLESFEDRTTRIGSASRPSGSFELDATAGSSAAATVWLARSEQTAEKFAFAPLSLDGGAICP